MPWTVETLNATVDAELTALPADMRARFARVGELIAAVGLERVGMPHLRHLEGPLWEIRVRGRDGIARALYVTARAQRIVVLRVFTKKTQTTPRKEIELAPGAGEGGEAMTKLTDLHREWSKNADYRAEYDRLEPEFELVRSIVEARARAGLTQAELAARMGTSQEAIARLEGGRVQPTTRTLARLARATGTRLHISFEPEETAAAE